MRDDGFWNVTTAVLRELDPFLEEVLACCPMIRSIWLVDDAPDGARLHAASLFTWDLIAFADPLSLHRLRRAMKLHRSDVRLRVLDNDNRLESAWGAEGRHGPMFASDWEEARPGEGFYTESTARAGLPLVARSQTRRRAVCVWQGIDPIKGPGS